MMDTPMVVRPLNPGQWEVWIGQHREIGVFDYKEKAIEVAEAESKSRDPDKVRPGVVVLNKDGQYQRFIDNPGYWEMKAGV
jgi:hypothetical protein